MYLATICHAAVELFKRRLVHRFGGRQLLRGARANSESSVSNFFLSAVPHGGRAFSMPYELFRSHGPYIISIAKYCYIDDSSFLNSH